MSNPAKGSYEFLDDIAIADVAFRAWGPDLDSLFARAAEAITAVMVDDSSSVRASERRTVALAEEDAEMLLFELLQALIYYKDAEELLLLPEAIHVRERGGGFSLEATLVGEPIDRARHPLNADVKAVTLHRFSVQPADDGWAATVVLDV